MTNLKQQIKKLIKDQNVIIPRLKAMDKTLHKLENDVKRHISKAWKAAKQGVELDILPSSGGSHTTSFDWDVLLQLPLYKVYGRNKWVKISYGGDNHWTEIQTEVDPPVDAKFFKSFIKQMSEELGLVVRFYEDRIPSRKQVKKDVEKNGCYDFDGLNAFYDDDLDLVKEGKVYYKGWDISDQFVICRKRSNNGWIIAYATNGHGFGYNEILEDPTKDELSTFLVHVEQDDNNDNIRDLF